MNDNVMPYNRMKAKKIKGQHCVFCGRDKVPLLKTPCCNHWICCDTKFVSIAGGGYCQEQHERFSLCYSHYIDKHSGTWQDCAVCKNYWSASEYKDYTGFINTPKFLIKP